MSDATNAAQRDPFGVGYHQRKVVVVPIRDRGMDLRDIELQTLAGRTLPQAARHFLDFLRLHLPKPGRAGAGGR